MVKKKRKKSVLFLKAVIGIFTSIFKCKQSFYYLSQNDSISSQNSDSILNRTRSEILGCVNWIFFDVDSSMALVKSSGLWENTI